MATRWGRIRSKMLARSVYGGVGAGIASVGIIVGRNTDRFWVVLLGIASAAFAGYFVLKAADKRWP